jgi:hypothetical protein
MVVTWFGNYKDQFEIRAMAHLADAIGGVSSYFAWSALRFANSAIFWQYVCISCTMKKLLMRSRAVRQKRIPVGGQHAIKDGVIAGV